MNQQLDSGSFWGYISSVFHLIGDSMSLHDGAIEALISDPHANLLVLGIFTVVFTSRALGQSAILLINQVPPRRFLVSIVVSTLIQGASILLWMLISWGTAVLFLGAGEVVSLRLATMIFILGHAPFALGILTLIPYIGVFWPNILRVWSLLCIGAAFVGMNMNVPRALMFTGIGFVGVLVFHRVMRPVLKLMNEWAWLHVGGVRKRYGRIGEALYPPDSGTGEAGS